MNNLTTGDKATDIRILALLLATKMEALEKEEFLYLWDEVITYLRQRELGKNSMEYEKLLTKT